MPLRLLLLSLAALVLNGCAGYKLGGSKPSHLAKVESLNVAIVKNDTQIPRAAALASNSIIDAITRDGTYRIATSETADARLITTLHKITYRQARSTRSDSLRSEELEMRLTLDWILVDGDNPAHILEKGRSVGLTRFFVDPNLPIARQTALPDALKRASESLVMRIADGF